MSFYVKIERLNGRYDHAVLGIWLNQSGVVEVDYFEGGWVDNILPVIAPHLRFEKDEDAVAYVLANGGEISQALPEMATKFKEEEA